MSRSEESRRISLFVCGDVMTGRGIDQILTRPSDPILYESYVRDARRYVELAEAVNGPIPRGVEPSYIWGEALDELQQAAPDVKIINFETAVTSSVDAWPGKGIHYRMHPRNVGCLRAAKIDCCVLANNHVLDWGVAGLLETLDTLQEAGFKTCGAGRDLERAAAPAIIDLEGRGRVLVFSFGFTDSGVLADWAATSKRPGVHLVGSFSEAAIERLAARIAAARRPGDVVVASIHWGSNWGYSVPEAHRRFARRLVEDAQVDVVHGHSSHHPRPIEVHRDRPILYGCGDFLNDYEGIGGYEEFRGDLALMYFLGIVPGNGRTSRLTMTPTRIRRFQVRRASPADATWLRQTLDRVSRPFGTRIVQAREPGHPQRLEARPAQTTG